MIQPVSQYEFYCGKCAHDQYEPVKVGDIDTFQCARCGKHVSVWQRANILSRNTTKLTPDTKELRALRLWHWRRAMSARGSASRYEQHGTRYQRKQYNALMQRANFHIRCVQALNDVVTGTAEQDHIDHPEKN